MAASGGAEITIPLGPAGSAGSEVRARPLRRRLRQVGPHKLGYGARAFRLAARILAMVAAVVVVTSIATGWLYWIRLPTTGWPGRRIFEALPLDELPGHASVPVTVFVVCFGLAGAALGMVSRRLAFTRLSAGIGLAIGVGLWMFLLDAFSIYVVRQDTMSQAARAAAGLRPVYIAAALAGTAGAALARPVALGAWRRGPWNRVLAFAVGLAGAADLAFAIIPRHRGGLAGIEGFAPSPIPPVATALVIPAGVILLLCARGLARGNVRAFRVGVVVLGISSVLHLLHGLEFGRAGASGLLAVALVARREDFRAPGDPSGRPRALTRLAATVVFVFVFGVTVLWVNRDLSAAPISLWEAIDDAAGAMIGLVPRAGIDVTKGFPQWLPLSIMSLMAAGAGWSAMPWLAPWTQRLMADRNRKDKAAEIVHRYGSDTLAPFALRADKSLFFAGGTAATAPERRRLRSARRGAGWFPPSGEVLIAYRVVRGIALVSGDPTGPSERVAEAMNAFLDYAHEHGWRVAILGASVKLVPLYRDLGMRSLYHGDEAVIDTESFSLGGGAMKSARQGVNRVERNGYLVEIVPASMTTSALRAELSSVEREWLGARPRKGFVMEMDGLFTIGGDDAIFVLARDAEGAVAAFLHLVVCQTSRTLSMSSMPRGGGLPNGMAAWLVAKTVEFARANGYVSVSLNFSPLAGLLEATDVSVRRRFERRAIGVLKRALSLQLDNLYLFNRQFQPDWHPRYLVYEQHGDLPRIAVAAMAAEGYLPFSARIRGTNWAQGAVLDDRPAEGAAVP